MGKRERSADIAQVGALIFQRPGPTAPPAAAPAAASGATPDAPPGATPGATPGAAPGRADGRGVPGGQLANHPATADRADRRTRRDVFDLDPRRVVERGPYIREWDEAGEEFEQLVAAVGARGEIDTPIWVRSHGAAGQRVFVLVAGKGRLRAALRNGLPLVPVRDLGEITDQQAVARQVEENLNRQDMTPAQTAHALWLSHGFGESISDIGRRLHRDKGYVSYMVKVGEALDALAPAEQARLARRGALQVRQCQAIGALPDLDSRVAELRRVLAAGADPAPDPPVAPRPTGRGAPPADDRRTGRPSRRADEEAAFYSRAIRGGRTFRMRWMEHELRADPAAVTNAFVSALQAEGARMVDALRRLEAEGGAGAAHDDLVRARRTLERFTRG
jgi:ParB-like chromosome segregation protein Spo0J